MDITQFFFQRFMPERLGFLAPATREDYLAAFHAWQRWRGRRMEFREVTAGSVAEFIGWYRQSHAVSTTNKLLRYCRSFFTHAVRCRVIAENPALTVPKLRELIDEPDVYTFDEFSLLLATARRVKGTLNGLPAGLFWYGLLLVLYDCGSRITATLSLRCRDVDLPNHTIYFRAASQKQRRGRRHLISDQTIAAIAAIWCPHRDLLFPWPYDRNVRQWPNLVRHLRKILREAGLPQFRKPFHAIRATSGSLVAAAGGNGASHLGHSNAAVFERHYRHSRLSPESQVVHLPRPEPVEGPMWYI